MPELMPGATRILLVDDEPALARLMQTYLGRLGHSVDICLTGAEARKLFSERRGEYNVLIADITLPDASGDALAIEFAERDGHLRVLLCSGYPVELSGVPAALRPRFEALQKPFVPNMLAGKIDQLIKTR
jgi:DNA-binding NtrC family response regulator